jgi:Na+-driven multidrug efflux pump
MIAKYGSEASAGYTNAIRLIVFFILPAWGMSNAVATLVGQNLGAKQPARAEESVMLASKYMTVFMLMVTFIFMFFPYQIVHILVPAEQVQVITYAVIALRIVSSAYIFYGIGMILNQVFNGAGDTKTPTLVYFVGFWLFQLPLAYVLHTYTTLGVTGIFWAVPIAETAMAIAIYVLYRKGSWKTIQV